MHITLNNDDIVRAVTSDLKSKLPNPITSLTFKTLRGGKGVTAEVVLGNPGEACITELPSGGLAPTEGTEDINTQAETDAVAENTETVADEVTTEVATETTEEDQTAPDPVAPGQTEGGQQEGSVFS